jgi:hypothetical protein
VGLERGALSLVSTTEGLLDRKVEAPVSKIENMAVGIRHADQVALSIRKTLAITSPTSGGRSVGIVHSRTQTMEFRLVFSFRYDKENKKNGIRKTKINKRKMREGKGKIEEKMNSAFPQL